MAKIQGTWDSAFEEVAAALGRNLDSGEDIGSSAAVVVDGEPVVDVWGGYMDAARTRPWERDTIVNNFSTTKTMTALCALILIDRGELDPEAPVARYWPEFAAAGKERVLVRHVLSHTSGLSGWEQPLTLEQLYDIPRSTDLLARQAPWWEPGTASGYHSISFGPLVGELVRRITGRSLGTFLAEEVAGPLGADYHIGTGPECDARVSPLIQASPHLTPTGMSRIAEKTFFNPFVSPQTGSSIPWRRTELGGSNGHGNARSVARVQSVLSNGGTVGGVRLLSKEGCARAVELHFDGVDRVFNGLPLRWGLGYGVNSPLFESQMGPAVAGHRVAYWGGSGGSFVVNDLDLRMTVAFVMNRHVEAGGWDHRCIDVIKAAYACVGAARSRA